MGLTVLTSARLLAQGADDNGVDVNIHPENGIFVHVIQTIRDTVGVSRLVQGY